MAKLPFAGAYFFEFFTYDGENYVSTKFRDDEGKVRDIDLACTISISEITGQGSACQADSFKSFISERLALAN